MSRKQRTAGALVATAAVALALSGPAGAATPTVSISGDAIGDYAFAPRKVEIAKGSAVKWAWESNAPHNVTFTKLSAHSKTESAGTFQHRFGKKGTYKYVCTIHGFSGKVVVGG